MIVVAHRGDNQYAPENTLSAFSSAISKGADAIEFDVHLTRDNQLIIHHDYYLGRTENGTGFIGDYTLAELKAFDIGSWFNKRFAFERMPTLSEVLEMGKGKVRFEIELRCAERSFLEKVLSEIHRYGITNDVEITSPHVPLLHHVKGTTSGLRKGIFFSEYPEWKDTRLGQRHVIDWMHLIDAQVVHLPISLVERDFVEQLHTHGFIVHAANLGSRSEIEKAISEGIDQFSTDKLGFALGVRDRIEKNAT